MQDHVITGGTTYKDKDGKSLTGRRGKSSPSSLPEQGLPGQGTSSPPGQGEASPVPVTNTDTTEKEESGNDNTKNTARGKGRRN